MEIPGRVNSPPDQDKDKHRVEDCGDDAKTDVEEVVTLRMVKDAKSILLKEL